MTFVSELNDIAKERDVMLDREKANSLCDTNRKYYGYDHSKKIKKKNNNNNEVETHGSCHDKDVGDVAVELVSNSRYNRRRINSQWNDREITQCNSKLLLDAIFNGGRKSHASGALKQRPLSSTKIIFLSYWRN